jgi:hypothetical protein
VDTAVDRLMGELSDVADPASEAAILAAAADLVGDPVTLEEAPQPTGRYGMVIRTKHGHVIVLDPELTGDLRFHTLLHEVGHLVLGHHDLQGTPDRLAALLTGRPVVSETSCAVPAFRELAQRENEAEQFASTVTRRLRRGLTNRHLSRLDEAFG